MSVLAHLDFRQAVIKGEALIPIIWKECTPKLLVVTDGLTYSTASGFGLSQFVNTLAASPIHGMIPIVVRASRGADPTADITNFDFTNPTNGLTKARYDVVFLFGITSEGQNQLPAAQVNAIGKFMQDGGGVFATGDHESLGASLSRDVPRVRHMRFWKQTETPNIGDVTRLSTNLRGDDLDYEFVDQSDVHPQRLYVNYRTGAGGIGEAHPLLQGGKLGAIEVFPDHPHEGECRVPSDLTTTFVVDGQVKDEWPAASGGSPRVSPEMVAMTMSHGDSFPGKEALVPRAFMSIVAYDGHGASVGRAVTDATWHHFVNINLDGTGSGQSGLQNPPGTDTPDLVLIRQYYRNLGTWLMPKKVRKCLRFPLIVAEVARFPLFEELRVPPLDVVTGEELHQIGTQVAAALAVRQPAWQAAELVADALEDGAGSAQLAKLIKLGAHFGKASARDLGLAALGGITIATLTRLAEVQNLDDIDPHKAFDDIVEPVARMAIRRYTAACRRELGALDVALSELG
jgi:hypothetical protein